MVLGSHNAWTFLRPKEWWMYLIRFTARCQKYDIQTQYTKYNSRCFDLRVKFIDGILHVAHGAVVYRYSKANLLKDLQWLNVKGGVSIRVIHEVRNDSDKDDYNTNLFRWFCQDIVREYPNVLFWCGMNVLRSGAYVEYDFKKPDPSCEELYASVQAPKLWDDWFPWIYAKRNNRKNIKKGTNREILMIDFVNIQ